MSITSTRMAESSNQDNPTKMIAISGKFASGKSTLMKNIKQTFEEQNMSVETMSIAGYLKQLCIEGFGMLPGEENKDRPLLIKVGSALRSVNKNVFLNILLHKVKESKANVIIIDDLRFLNEAEMLASTWVQIRVEAPEDVRIERVKNKYPDTFQQHLSQMNSESETQLDSYKFDHIINTNWTQEEFENLIKKIT